MTSLLGKFVFKKILKETQENKQGREDPYFEHVPTRSLVSFSGKPKMKKRKKALPPGLSKEDEQTLVKVKRRAYRLDMALGSFLGVKVGWGSVIGIFPVIGDAVDTALALMVIRTCSEANLPASLLIHMLLNVLFDFLIGLIPLIGDLADMAYKANTRNAILLEDHLRERGLINLQNQGKTNISDPSLQPVEAETEVGTVDGNHVTAGSSSGGKTWARNQRDREFDLEAQRGGSSSKATKGAKISKPPKAKRDGRGHARLYSQETGTT